MGVYIPSYVNGHLRYIHILEIVNNASMHTGACVSSQISVFVFFRYIPSNGNAGSYSSSIFSCFLFFFFFFLRNLQQLKELLFSMEATPVLHFQQRIRLPFSSHLHQHLLFMLFLIIVVMLHQSHQTGVG